MSTELFDAGPILDEIFNIAGVPPEKNDDHFYNTARDHLTTLIKSMDDYGLTMDEQRRRMGRKKDELISELIRLKGAGVVKGYEERRAAASPLRVHMNSVQRVN